MFNNQIRELIPIEVHNGQRAVNARHLYAWLEIKKDFNFWMKRQIVRCDLTENQDFEVFYQEVGNPQGGRPSTDYALSLNAAKEISMMSQTKRGKEARRYFIECERIAMQSNTSSMLPKNYKQALAQLLAQVEQNEQLQLENKKKSDRISRQHIVIGIQNDVIKKNESKIKELQDDNETKQNIINLQMGELDSLTPKGRVYDQVMQTPNADYLKTTSSIANEIGMSGQKLNKMLVACGIIYKAPDGEYIFTADYRKWNLGKSISAMINEEKGLVKTYIKWNTRGRAYIHALNDTNWDKRRAWHLLKNGNESETVKA